MPERSKIRWSQLKVGVVAFAAMVILGVLIFLLTGNRNIFERDQIVRTYMADGAGMTESTPVRLNGILAGAVQGIRLSGSKDPRRAVEFRLTIQEKYMREIPEDSTAAVTAANLLGSKFIDITKGKSATPVKPGGELRSLQTQDIPELMAQSANLIQTLQDISKRADDMLADINAGKGNLGKLLRDEELYKRLNAIAAEGQQLLADVRNGKGTLSKLIYDDSLYQEVRAPIKRIDQMLADLQQGQGTAGKLLKDPQVYDEAQQTLAEMRRLTQELNAGKGTAGKLLKDDQLYTQLTGLTAKLDATIDRINSGQGTVGQLLVNPQMYEAMNGAMREFQGLAKDIRSNPKKFLRIKLAIF
ncbi:MAG: MlaD family protein [Bryobacteraceae bacterium]|jgi:phospholipid/cholesterol/gamma-HCH transport system substrate-binding protein